MASMSLASVTDTSALHDGTLRGAALRDGRRLLGSRPGRLRLAAIVVAIALLGAGVFGFIAASEVISKTDDIEESTGPVLIGTQEMFASLAEADAAATAVHLSGVEGDRAQRALYERALARSSASLERVARQLGDDPESHARLENLSQSLTQYAGLVESSRVMNEQSIPGADDELRKSIELVRGSISDDVAAVTARMQDRLDEEIGVGTFYPAMGVYVLAVLVVLGAMVYLAMRFRRILNPPLFLAAIVTIGVAGWFGYSYFAQQASLQNARDGGYESIRLTSEIQSLAFRYKADESLSLIEGRTAGFDAQQAQRRLRMVDSGSGLIPELQSQADSPREQAVADLLGVRWQRYALSGTEISEALALGQAETAIAVASGKATSAFNGLNTQVESVLSDNQAQFLEEVDDARQSLDWLRWVVVIGAVLAALLAWSGFALRIREYQ